MTGNGVGAEYNSIAFYPGLTREVFARLDRLDVPKVILGNEQGWRVPTGGAYNALPEDHPVRLAYAGNNAVSSLVAPGRTKDNPAYDELALYYIANGTAGVFEERPGRAEFGDIGSEHPPGSTTTTPATPGTGGLSSPRVQTRGTGSRTRSSSLP